MGHQFFYDFGKQFYEWHKDNKIQFEFKGHSRDVELEVERIAGLIDYVGKKKEALLKKSLGKL